MNKKILVSVSSLVLAVVFMLTSFVQAKEYLAVADFNDMTPEIIHNSPRVDTVISCNMVLKPKTQADFSRLCSSAVSNVKYYFNDSNSEEDIKKGPDYTDIVDGEVFYPATSRISNSYIGGTISYKVMGDFQTKKSNGERILKEVPEDSYQKAVIISSITKQVDLGVATTVSVPTGDQSQPNWTGTSGVFPGFEGVIVDWEYNFGFLDDNGNVSGVSKFFKVKSKNNHIINIKAGSFGVADGHIIFGSGQNTTALPEDLRNICLSSKGLYIQYNENKDACDSSGNVLMEDGWVEISKDDYSRFSKTSDGNISYPPFMNAWIRIYAITEEQSAGSCRPIRRTIVKGRIGQRYPGFEFPNLVEGDVVKIFSVNGKKIAEVSGDSSGKIVWDGRKDNGDWAKSGIYIYQIKVKETGKLISGTIVFVY